MLSNPPLRVITLIFSILLSLTSLQVESQRQQMTVEEYIEKYSDLAIKEMRQYGIPASITMAQGILESDNGSSELATIAKNHFGIKCQKEWSGKSFIKDDDKKNECFRRYASVEDSYRDHSLFLRSRDHYAFLFRLELTDYRSWAYGLKQAGYATNPRYPEMLIKIIEENGLDRLDRRGLHHGDVISGIDSLPPSPLAGKEGKYPDFHYDLIGTGGDGRKMYLNNGVKFIYARRSDTFYSIADEFGIYSWQIIRYNDLTRNDKLSEGQMIYLLPKKRSAQQESHVAESGETLHSISQKYGIKLQCLAKRNDMAENQPLEPGMKILLK